MPSQCLLTLGYGTSTTFLYGNTNQVILFPVNQKEEKYNDKEEKYNDEAESKKKIKRDDKNKEIEPNEDSIQLK